MKKILYTTIVFATALNPMLWAQSQLLDRVVAVVNDEIVTQSELDTFLRPFYEELRADYEGEELIVKFNEIRTKLLNQLIEDKLVLQEAKKRAVEPDRTQVEARLEEIKKQFPDRGAMEQTLTEQGLTLRDLRERLERQSMIRRLQDSEVRAKVIVSPSEVEDYYKNHTSEFSHSDRVKVRSITVKRSEASREKGTMDEEAKKKIEMIRERLLAGEEFGSLAVQFSEDLQAQAGGLSEWISRNEMIPAVDQTLFNLSVGQISELVETPMGFHLFRLEEKESGYQRTFDEVREEIFGILYREKGEERFQEWMRELKRNAYISLR